MPPKQPAPVDFLAPFAAAFVAALRPALIDMVNEVMADVRSQIAQVPSDDGDPMLPLAKVVELTGMSKTAIYNAEANGTFPAGQRLPNGRVVYRKSVVDAFLRKRPVRGLAKAGRPT